MRKRLLYVCPVLLAASAAWAVPVCTMTTLNVYTANDANNYSCTLDGLTFSDFSYTASGLPTEMNVELMPTFDKAGDVGFIIDGAFTAGAGLSSNAILSYEVSSSSASITGATASLVSYGASGSGAAASIVESLCTTTPTGTGSCVPAGDAYGVTVSDNVSHPPAVQSNSVTFALPTSTVFVSKNIAEVGGSGSATISSFENTVQTSGGGGTSGGGQTPEPASFFTMGSGLIAASMLVRRKFRKARA